MNNICQKCSKYHPKVQFKHCCIDVCAVDESRVPLTNTFEINLLLKGKRKITIDDRIRFLCKDSNPVEVMGSEGFQFNPLGIIPENCDFKMERTLLNE